MITAVNSTTGSAVSGATIDSGKTPTRSHQILSRETSFISKPVSIDEKDETATIASSTLTSVQATNASQIANSTISATAAGAGTVASTVTITGKFH